MFPTRTNFEIRTIDKKRILFADTTFKDFILGRWGFISYEEIILSTSLGCVVDKEYSMPLRFTLINGRIRFHDIKFIDIYREDVL